MIIDLFLRGGGFLDIVYGTLIDIAEHQCFAENSFVDYARNSAVLFSSLQWPPTVFAVMQELKRGMIYSDTSANEDNSFRNHIR